MPNDARHGKGIEAPRIRHADLGPLDLLGSLDLSDGTTRRAINLGSFSTDGTSYE